MEYSEADLAEQEFRLFLLELGEPYDGLPRTGTVFNVGDPVIVVDDTIGVGEFLGRRGIVDSTVDYSEVLRVLLDGDTVATWFEDTELEIDNERTIALGEPYTGPPRKGTVFNVGDPVVVVDVIAAKEGMFHQDDLELWFALIGESGVVDEVDTSDLPVRVRIGGQFVWFREFELEIDEARL